MMWKNHRTISTPEQMIAELTFLRQMLEKAFAKVKETKGIIFHSDQGWQYQHTYYQKTLKNHGIIQSMSRKGNCLAALNYCFLP
jgi:putative transposase